MSAGFSAVFLDRDGVLNRCLPADYVKSPDELVVLPGVAGALRRLNDSKVPVIVISNQQGVGKGLMTASDLLSVQSRLEEVIARKAGARIDRFYYCTDLKTENSLRRKPAPGMLIEAAQDFDLNLAETAFIGDSSSDIAAGRAAGVSAAILVLSGATSAENAGLVSPRPDRIFTATADAVDWIIEQNNWEDQK